MVTTEITDVAYFHKIIRYPDSKGFLFFLCVRIFLFCRVGWAGLSQTDRFAAPAVPAIDRNSFTAKMIR